MKTCSGLVIAVMMTTGTLNVLAQELTLDTVLARAATYVAEFNEKLSGIVAEEIYIQQVRTSGTHSPERRLKSDLLLVRPNGYDRYVEFRDVFEVNGRPVRDRAERLTRLFLDPEANANQVKAIIDESARHNIGSITRNVNTPMLPLYFLQQSQQKRFRFKHANAENPQLTGFGSPDGGRASFRVSTETWVVAFTEMEKRTVIRSTDGRDFPAAGRLWIDPSSGAVLMTELVMDGHNVRAVVDVSYQSEPLLGFRVPVEMRERYIARGERVDGVARYGKFRQFQVWTDEIIESPEKLRAKPAVKPPQ